MYNGKFLPIKKRPLSLKCLSPFISITRTKSCSILSSYIFQLNIPSLGSPNDWRVFKYQPATNSTQSCDYRKHFAGYHVWDPNSEENHLHVTWVDLALQCVRDLESIALPSAPASLVLPCLCREVVHLHFWLVTFTSIFNFIPFHPLCWVITIIFIQILCKEL